MKKLLLTFILSVFSLLIFQLDAQILNLKELNTFDADTITNTDSVFFELNSKILGGGDISYQVTHTRLSGTTGYHYFLQYSNDGSTWISRNASGTNVVDTNATYSFMAYPGSSTTTTTTSSSSAIDTSIVSNVDTAFVGTDTVFVYITTSTITTANTGTTTITTETVPELPALYERLYIVGDSTQSVKFNVVGLYKIE